MSFRHPNIASGASSMQTPDVNPSLISIQSTEDNSSVYNPSFHTDHDADSGEESDPEIIITNSPFEENSRKRRASESLTDTEESDDDLIILGSDGETQEEKKTTSDLLHDAVSRQNSVKTLTDVTCPICFDEIEQCVVSPCGHFYCSNCVYRALASSKGKFKGLIDSRSLRCRYHSVDRNFCVCGSLPLVSSPLRKCSPSSPDNAFGQIQNMSLRPSSSSSSSSSSCSFPSLTLSYFTKVGRPRQWSCETSQNGKENEISEKNLSYTDPKACDASKMTSGNFQTDNVTALIDSFDTDASAAMDISSTGMGNIIKFVSGSDYMFNKKLMTLLHKDQKMKYDDREGNSHSSASNAQGFPKQLDPYSNISSQTESKEAGLDKLRCRPCGKKNKILLN
ncbi:hypothetical protein KL925_000946 [Ogataea polymorpha]|nr:hypothetical protein KL925_000946 [Ogataea polymorpha]